MHRSRLCLAAAVAVGAPFLASCAGAVSDAYEIQNDPGHAEPIAGSDLSRVSVTPRAAERLQLDTTPVTRRSSRLSVPAQAVFVDTGGKWWVYKAVAPHTYVRHQVQVERERDGRMLLADGPRPGTELVTVGVAELYGIETGIGH